VPVILGSDKTTVSVATGQNDYYPLYASIGNVRNNVRRAHRNAVAVIGFLAMPKSEFLSICTSSLTSQPIKQLNNMLRPQISAISVANYFIHRFHIY
jgi:hypothetical protein